MGHLVITGGEALPKTRFMRWPLGVPEEAAAVHEVLTDLKALGIQPGDEVIPSAHNPGRHGRTGLLLKAIPIPNEICGRNNKGIPRTAFVAALQLEGFLRDGLFYEPVYRSPLFPVKATDFPALSRGREKLPGVRNTHSCPVEKRAAYHQAVWFMHPLFLASRQDVDANADGITEILENSEDLRGLDDKLVRNQRLSRDERES